MHTLALICQKGGSGKTTLAIHLATEAATHGRRTLLLDLDPQASAARWADRRKPTERDIDVAVESPARLEPALRQAERDGYAFVVLDTAPHADAAALQSARSTWYSCPCAARSSIWTRWARASTSVPWPAGRPSSS